MSEIASTLGLPVSFPFEGRDLKVSARDLTTEGLFSRWLEGQALRAIQRHEADLGPAVFAAQMDSWQRACAAGVYDWGMQPSLFAMCGPSGQKEMAYLQLLKENPEIDRELVERLYDDDEAWRAFQDAQRRADSDPNRPRPGRKAAPRP